MKELFTKDRFTTSLGMLAAFLTTCAVTEGLEDYRALFGAGGALVGAVLGFISRNPKALSAPENK